MSSVEFIDHFNGNAKKFHSLYSKHLMFAFTHKLVTRHVSCNENVIAISKRNYIIFVEHLGCHHVSEWTSVGICGLVKSVS